MAAVAAHPWGDTVDAATLRVALPQARTLAQRSLRAGSGWDRGLFDLAADLETAIPDWRS